MEDKKGSQVMCKIEDKKGSQVVCKIVYTQTLDGTGP
jgi:hypothetical protein